VADCPKLKSGAWTSDDGDVILSFDLAKGETTIRRVT
jgi:hypothetical protein